MDIGPGRQQHFCGQQVAAFHHFHQQGLPVLADVYIGPGRQQGPDYRQVAAFRSVNNGSITKGIPSIHLCPRRQKQAHNPAITVGRGHHQRAFPGIGLNVGADSLRQQVEHCPVFIGLDRCH